jgi:hypothetical protein
LSDEHRGGLRRVARCLEGALKDERAATGEEIGRLAGRIAAVDAFLTRVEL